MNLGFIILAHQQPDVIRRLTDLLAVDPHRVVIHFDRSATAADLEAVRKIAAEKPDRIRVISKVHCIWGEWSLVSAVLLALREFEKFSQLPDYVHLMSGADLPIRPIAQLEEFLQRNPDQDFIECCDISERNWVKGGLSRERFRFYFPFNFRTHRKSFDRLVRWQRKLKIRRKMPAGLRPHMGSQWWTLRWSTCRGVLDFTDKHPKVPRFFKSTWIPDESYFQTVIARFIPKAQIADLQLMFHHLTPSGRPYVFYNDHLGVIKRLPHFFIRKVSPEAAAILEFDFQSELSRARIPSRKALSKIRDLIRGRIDANHRFTQPVPGFYEEKATVPAGSNGQPAAPPAEVLRSKISRPVVALLVQKASDIDRIQALVEANPDLCWLGRPYAPSTLEMPAGPLERMGLTQKSRKTRDLFNRQFTRYLMDSTPPDRIPVFVLMPTEDKPDLGTLGLFECLLPILVTHESLKVFNLSRIKAAAFALAPEIVAGIVEVDEAKLEGTLRDLAAESLPIRTQEVPRRKPQADLPS